MKLKKILKRVFQVLGAIIALAIVAILVKCYLLSPKSRPAPNVVAPTTPEAIARGEYLANNVALCMACHSTPGQEPGAGRAEFRISDLPGKGHVPNITPDKATGIGDWTDGEVLRAMREGLTRDGRALVPVMPYPFYRTALGDDDALAIIAYLRTLKPVKNDPGRYELGFPVSMLARLAPRPVETPPPPAPPASDKKARGEYLIKLGLCHGCHDNHDAEKKSQQGFAGGVKFEVDLPNAKGYVLVPNISSDKATGIGSYSDEDLRRVFEEGVGKAGPFVTRGLGMPYEMPWAYFKGMTNEDKEALIAALRDAPPVSHVVPPSSIVRK